MCVCVCVCVCVEGDKHEMTEHAMSCHQTLINFPFSPNLVFSHFFLLVKGEMEGNMSPPIVLVVLVGMVLTSTVRFGKEKMVLGSF